MIHGRNNSTDAWSASREKQGGIFANLDKVSVKQLVREVKGKRHTFKLSRSWVKIFHSLLLSSKSRIFIARSPVIVSMAARRLVTDPSMRRGDLDRGTGLSEFEIGGGDYLSPAVRESSKESPLPYEE